MFLIAVLLLVGCGRVSSQRWIDSSYGRIPSDAFSGETYDKNNNLLYICKGDVENTVACGKTSTSMGNCRIPYNLREHSLSSGYMVLTRPPWAEYTLEWTSATYSYGRVPSDAVSGGYGVYVGRYRSGRQHMLGKVVPRKQKFYYGDNGNERYKESGYQVLVMKPRRVRSYQLSNVVYDLSRASQTISPGNVILSEKFVENKTPFDTTSSLSMEVTQSTTSEWSEMSSVEIHAGLEMTVSAGIPGVFDSSLGWSISESSTSSFSYGESHTTSETTVHEISVNLPAHSNVTVSMIAKRANVNVPYRASVTKVFADGATYTYRNVDGVYTNVHFTSFQSIVDSDHHHDEMNVDSDDQQNTTTSSRSIHVPSEAPKTFSLWSKPFVLVFQLTLFMLM